MPKYRQAFTSKHGVDYTVSSCDDYVFNPKDFYDLIKIFLDPPVYEFITKGVLKKYYPKTPFAELLASDFLRDNAKLWKEKKEYRFFVRRKSDQVLVGIVGFNLPKKDYPERWIYKISSEPSFMITCLPICLGFMAKLGHLRTFGLVNVNNTKMNQLSLGLGYKKIKKVRQQGNLHTRYEINWT